MPTANKLCKVCGKEYPYCQTGRRVANRWQDVACCPEHAEEYFRKIRVSRGQLDESDTNEQRYPATRSGKKSRKKITAEIQNKQTSNNADE